MVLVVSLVAPILSTAQPRPSNSLDDLRRSFVAPPADSRIMMRWWWFGPAVTKREIERELQAMKAGGIGGVEVQPVYPLMLDDPSAGVRNLPYLSDEFIDALRFAAEKARELGLRLDLKEEADQAGVDPVDLRVLDEALAEALEERGHEQQVTGSLQDAYPCGHGGH